MKHYFFLALLLGVFAFGCGSKVPQKINIAGEAQGTYYAISYFDQQNRNLQPQIDSLLKAFDQSVSLWVDNSIISRINRGDTTVLADPVFTYNFNLSKEVGALTDGYFDFTIGPLVSAWGFHRKNKMEMSPKQIDSLKQLVDYRKVHLVDGKIFRDDERMSFDFNAVAQGYSTDLIANLLQSYGIKSYVVDVGGEIASKEAKPDGSPWLVGIESPANSKDDERTLDVIIKLENKGLATSGSYRKYFEQNGKRYSHAIDPKTGYPVDHHLLSVTVLADNAAMADALATAFMVMGLDKSLELLKTIPNIDAYFIYWTQENVFETYATEGIKKLIVE